MGGGEGGFKWSEERKGVTERRMYKGLMAQEKSESLRSCMCRERSGGREKEGRKG